MQKVLQFNRFYCLMTLMLFSVVAMAEAVTDGIFYYSSNDDGTWTVTLINTADEYPETVTFPLEYQSAAVTDVILKTHPVAVKNLVVPNGIHSVTFTKKEDSSNSFAGNPGPESIIIQGANTEIFGNCEAVTNLSHFTFPSALETIPERFFRSCTNLKTVEMPASLKSIGDAAFLLTKIESIDLPNSLEEIGACAFFGTNLKSVVVPEKVKRLPYGKNILNGNYGLSTTYWDGGVFTSCTQLETVVLPEGLTLIDKNTFSLCEKLISCPIPSTVDTIGERAFYSCKVLQDASLPEGLAYIGEAAFERCWAFVGDIVIPGHITHIPTYAFQSSGINSVTVSEGTTVINQSAFSGCTSLKWASLPSSVDSLGMFLFSGCTALETVTIAEGATVDTIPHYMCNGCSSLKSISIPDCVKSIGAYAFNECTALEDFVFPSQLLSIDNECFAYCTIFTSLRLPGNMKSIGKKAFYNCKSITDIYLPSTMESIEEKAFYYNPIASVTSLALTPPAAGKECFGYDPYSIKLYVPETAIDAYKSAYVWSNLYNIFPIIDENKPAAPVLSNTGGYYSEPFYLTISKEEDESAEGVIYYMKANSLSAFESTEAIVYTEPILISDPLTYIRAYVQLGELKGDVVDACYEYLPPRDPELQVYVCGINVNDKSFSSTFGSRVRYSKGVLTLTNAKLTASDYSSDVAINADDGELIIDVVGECKLTASHYGIIMGAYAGYGGYGGNLTIRGTGEDCKLVINVDDKGQCGMYGYLGNITIDNCNVTINGGAEGATIKWGEADGLFTVRGSSRVELKCSLAAIGKVAALILEDGLSITEPEGAVFENNTIMLGSTEVTHAVIGKVEQGDGIQGVIDNSHKTKVCYDLTGRKIQTVSYPGLYIIDGKKVVVR